MKKITLILMAAAVLSGCSAEDDTLSSVGYGSVRIASEIESTAQVVVRSSTYDIPSSLIPTADDFSLSLVGEYVDIDDGSVTHQYAEEFASISEYNTYENGSNPPSLWSGNYTATISDGNDTSVESTTNACFGSSSVDFTVDGEVYDKSITISAQLINSIIRLSADDWFKSYFSAASFTITTSSGNEFVFDPFDSDNDSKIVFVAPDTTLKLSGTATRVSSGATVTFSQSSIGTVIAGYMNTINVEASSVGSLDITITINDSIIEIHEEEYDLNS